MPEVLRTVLHFLCNFKEKRKAEAEISASAFLQGVINLTVLEAIQKADMTTPNAFSPEVKVEWLNEVEGMVQTQVLLFAPEEIITYEFDADTDTVLLVAEPHSKLYPSYLRAMMDFASGDYNRYQNTMAMFNQQFREFMCWFATIYRPADTHEEEYV